MRLQLDQLLEFKRAILESQAQLQKELQRVKQEAKDAMVEQQSKLQEGDEYQEMLEMATLDKEMAEEKVLTLLSISVQVFAIFLDLIQFNCFLPLIKLIIFFSGRELTTRIRTSKTKN